MDFNHDGTWSESQQGPAIHAPDNVKNIIVEKYRIEWLNISDPKENFYAKNHMVATLVFSEGVIINNLNYFSARLSMELGPEERVAEIVSQEVRNSTPILTSV